MTAFVTDLENVESDTLAAKHFKNRYIQERQCYTCHSDYGFAGTLRAKLDGLGHVWREHDGHVRASHQDREAVAECAVPRLPWGVAEVPAIGRPPERGGCPS